MKEEYEYTDKGHIIIDVVRDGPQLVFVNSCPFCGLKHRHGASGWNGPIGAADGHRAAHCSMMNEDTGKGYHVREVKNEVVKDGFNNKKVEG